MKFNVVGSVPLSKVDQDLVDAIELPEVEQYFIDPEIKGLANDFEDIHLLCIHKKHDNNLELTTKKYSQSQDGQFVPDDRGIRIRKITHVDIEDKADEASATAVFHPSEIEKQCPSDKYHRVWFHTHTHSISAQSINDRNAGFRLKTAKIGEAMCAVGINGVKCHLYHEDLPPIIRGRWSNNFWQQIDKKTNLLSINGIDKTWKKTEEYVVNIDQLLCNVLSKKGVSPFECFGRDWEKGIRSFPIGDFDTITTEGSIDYMNEKGELFFIATAQDEKLNCRAIHTESSGKKLICI